MINLNFRFSKNAPQKIGVVMLNMGGPAEVRAVKPFLRNMFSDRDLMQSNSLFVRYFLSRILTAFRLSRIKRQYADIGGGSPILKWTKIQGENMALALNDDKSLVDYTFKPYVSFRYVQPDAYTAVKKMLDDGVTHAVAFSQYPQYSCTTTGSSLTHLWKAVKEIDTESKIKWSIIDRWPENEHFIGCLVNRIKSELVRFISNDYVDNKDVFAKI